VRCTRCGGFATAGHDKYGGYTSCITCGHEQHDQPPDPTPPPSGTGHREPQYRGGHQALRALTNERLERMEQRYAWALQYAARQRQRAARASSPSPLDGEGAGRRSAEGGGVRS
jgi:hypothetical protein